MNIYVTMYKLFIRRSRQLFALVLREINRRARGKHNQRENPETRKAAAGLSIAASRSWYIGTISICIGLCQNDDKTSLDIRFKRAK